MATDQQPERFKQNQESASSKTATETLQSSCDELIEYGGYELIEASVEGAKAMNPESKARKNIFLTESSKIKEREKLKRGVQIWLDLLESSEDVSEMLADAQEKSQKASDLIKNNLKQAVETVKPLECSYRTAAMFYKNAEADKIKNISILNASPERLKDLDNTLVIDKIGEELKQNHDRLDLRENYSLLVLPGYLGSNKVVEKWAKLAYQNKVMLITDFQHLDNADDVMEDFDAANLTGGEVERSNVMMTCNWLVGREKYDDLDEDDELFIPPSAALAGKLYSTLIAQPSAGKMHGGLNEVDGVKFELKKSEVSELEKRGLIPMVSEWGKVMAFSAKTLYSGNDIGLQTYSVVRVFDFIGKVLIDFLNRQAFVNWTTKVERDLKLEMGKYLSSIKGHDKIIESFKILNLKQDKETKRIYLDIHITPFFPAKNFILKLGGTKGDTAEEWSAEITEE